MEQQKLKRNIEEINESSDIYQVYASLAFMVVVIVIGVPMWWKTTEVYRVSLPYSAIKSLDPASIRISTKIGIYTYESERSAMLIEELKSQFTQEEFLNIQFTQIREVENAKNFKTPVALEALILKQFPMRTGDFLFYEWHNTTEDIFVTSDRSALISSETSATKIANLLKLNLLQSYKMKSVLNKEEQFGIKSSPPQPEYDVLITVINPRPDEIEVNWNAQLAAETYLAPFLDYIRNVSSYSLKTDWRFQVPFEFPVKQIRDTSVLGRHYALMESTLPHIITTIEKNIDGGITNNPCINLVLFIPPCDIAPLHIYKASGQKHSTNNVESFISPKWGSVVIHNPPNDVCLKFQENREKVTFNINSKDVMQIIVYHLQKLTEIHMEITINGVSAAEAEHFAPRTWEYDSYVRLSCLKHLTTTIHSLQSLVKLLDDISYIVITDEVGVAINEAHEKAEITIKYLNEGDLLSALQYAKQAFIASEKAFFDASLLAQLYFPDEQKYAIYIPLFLPILVPVISSLAMIKKYFAARKEKKLKEI